MGKIKTSISLYSLQNEYLNGRMSLDDIFQFLKDNKIDGVEILPDQMIPGAPEPDEETLAHWHELVDKYHQELSCTDVFLNTNLYDNRTLTLKEDIKLMKKEIELAHKMGFKTIRMISMTPPEVVKPILPLVLGHEGAGVVVAKGENVTNFEVGDHAGVKWVNSTCQSC